MYEPRIQGAPQRFNTGKCRHHMVLHFITVVYLTYILYKGRFTLQRWDEKLCGSFLFNQKISSNRYMLECTRKSHSCCLKHGLLRKSGTSGIYCHNNNGNIRFYIIIYILKYIKNGNIRVFFFLYLVVVLNRKRALVILLKQNYTSVCSVIPL